jgi:hypothetical protein
MENSKDNSGNRTRDLQTYSAVPQPTAPPSAIKTTRRNKYFLNSIVAEDETWFFRYDPTTKRQIAEWKTPASPKGQKNSSSKVKSEDNPCAFLRQRGKYSPLDCP